MPRCFGIARKEEADCKASRPDEPKAKPYPSTEGINMKSLLAFDDYNLFEKIIALNFPFYDKNDVIEFFKTDAFLSDKDIHGLTDTRFMSFCPTKRYYRTFL